MNGTSQPKMVRLSLLLVALTIVFSLLYGVEYYLGGPVRPSVTSEIHDIALHPDNILVAAGAQDGIVRLWRIPRNRGTSIQNPWTERELSGHTGPVVSVAFTPSGSTLSSASQDGTIRLWDVASGEIDKVLNVPGNARLYNASLAGDGSRLATINGDGVVQVWPLATIVASSGGDIGSVELQTLGPVTKGSGAVALSPDGALVAAGDGPNIEIWDTSTGEAVGRLEGYWEDPEAQEDWLGHDKAVTALAFSPDGELLASGGADKQVVFWELATGEVTGVGDGHFATITTLTFDADGNTLLSGSADYKAKTWRVPGGSVSGTYVGHLGTVNGVAFGPDAQSIVTGADDGTLRVWDTVNTSVTHTEWTRQGLQSVWGKLFSAWMPISGLVALVGLGGMWRARRWGHLLNMTLFVVGPIIVLGLPLLDTYFYPFSIGTRLGIAWPLLLLALWYGGLVSLLTREPVATYYEAPQAAALAERIMIGQRTRQLRKAIFIGAVWVLLLVILYSVLRQFNLDLSFMAHFFSFIMAGAGLTVRVSALSITLAVVLALFGALGRLSGNSIANGVSGFYISLIRGTPLLVQIYIWYLGLPRLNIILPAEVAGILALGVNYGAYMTEIFRAGMQAIGKGQHEAAQALGMSRSQTLRRIVLPQAFRIVIPPIGNDFIAMMKDSSLVSIMAVWELSFRAQKIGRQYFRSLETFMIAAGFYWILTVIFQFLQGKLEDYMARGERR